MKTNFDFWSLVWILRCCLWAIYFNHGWEQIYHISHYGCSNLRFEYSQFMQCHPVNLRCSKLTNAMFVERCFILWKHIINTGAVSTYVELVVLHCQSRPKWMLLLLRVRTRLNMSTAAVERQPAKRTRGTENMNYLCIFSIFYIFSISKKISKRAAPRGVGPIWDAYFKFFFIFLKK
jgi:hypothetical protein